MKTNEKRYRQLRDSLMDWKEVALENNRIASLQQSLISGGIDLTDDWAEQERLRRRCLELTREIIANNGRLSTLLELHDELAFNDHGGADVVRDEVQRREWQRENDV